MQHTFFKNRETLRSEIVKANDKILKIINNVSLALDEELYPKKKDSYHFLMELLYPNTRVEKTLFACLATVMQKSELMSAGSSYISILFSAFLIKELIKHPDLLNQNEHSLNEYAEKIYNNFKQLITFNSKILIKEKLYKEIDKICQDKILSAALKEALDLAGLEGKLHVEESQQSNYLIELKNGYCFHLNPFKFFLKDDKWQEHNVKMLVIDGIIEKVSELNTILNKTMESKIPMVIVAHGFSEEVVATLKANRDRNILNILPVRLFSGLESLNVINDIGIVCGGDILSSLKGEQVQFVDYDRIPTVETVVCTMKEFVIENSRSVSAVSGHIKNLLKKRENNIAIEDICNLIDNRIKSLFSHSVIIHLPNMTKTEKDNTKMKIDIVLRTCKTLLSYGIVDAKKVLLDFEKEHTKDELNKILLITLKNTISNMETTEIPTLSLFAGTYFSLKIILPLLNSKGFIESEI